MRQFLVGYELILPGDIRQTNRSFIDSDMQENEIVTKHTIVNFEISVLNEWRGMGVNAKHARIFTFQEINR